MNLNTVLWFIIQTTQMCDIKHLSVHYITHSSQINRDITHSKSNNDLVNKPCFSSLEDIEEQ